ncbi:inositol monophosphatase family protein [Rickettsiales bacterium]|nr:inositol monophosphatase family protein [Rickettsiales bacterium]
MINQNLINFAHELADISGDIAKKYFRTNFDEVQKSDKSPVTQADKQIEMRLRAEIHKKFPDHGIIGEEFANENSDAEYKWIIDPIDGTISFAIGKPIFGTLIALTFQDKPILGIINQPVNNERWWGIENDKAYFNDITIKTKNCQQISDAVFCTQSPFFFEGRIKERIEMITCQTKYQHQGGAIYSGDCYHFALLAHGFVDIIIEHGLNNYDFLALVPIIESAGGVITNWQGEKLNVNSDGRVIATSSQYLHELTINYLQ